MSLKDTFLNRKSFINTGGSLQSSTQQIWGILNLTPDSFYDGGKNNSINEAIQLTAKMLNDGAHCIDVGGASSRPGALQINTDEEINRIIPFIKEAIKTFPDIKISVDTNNSKVARVALNEGAVIINDISGGKADQEIFNIAKEFNAPLVLMHMRGNASNMQDLTQYQNVTSDVIKELSEQINIARSTGINDLIIDPGFGFSKTIPQNFELLNHLQQFKILGLPLLVGFSRKSMIYKTLEISAGEALNGTTVLNTIALLKGADILRVHDVKEAKEIINLVNQLK